MKILRKFTVIVLCAVCLCETIVTINWANAQAQTIADSVIVIEEMREPVQAKFEPLQDVPLSDELQEHVFAEAERIGIEPMILFRLMERESQFDENAWRLDINGYESWGLCQVNDITADFMRERSINYKTSKGNITGAAELISYYMNERGCTLLEALAAYGAGYSNMRQGKGFEAARALLGVSK